MMFQTDYYDPETIALMSQALDAAWKQAEYARSSNTFDPTGLRRSMALRIMAAVGDGERDLERLKELAHSAAKHA